MKKKRLSLILVFAVILTLFAGTLTVCADEQQTTRINLSSATVNLGDADNKLQLEIENLPSGRRPRWVSWNENVAKVERVGNKGVVTPLRTGTAYISSGLGFPRMVCKVKVVAPSVKLNKKAVTLYHGTAGGTTAQLKATVKGADKNITWSSSNESIVTVADGRVTPVAEGLAVITARANGKSASCAVTVKENAISLNLEAMTLSTKGIGSAIKLQPTVIGARKNVRWTTDNSAIATVSGGKVTGKGAGEATITAEANGVTATCKVTVKPGVDSKPFLSINEEKVQLYSKQTKVLKTNKAKADQVEWSSSDTNVATVDAAGRVTAVAEGTAAISVKRTGAAVDEAYDTCKIVVTEPKTVIKEQLVYLTTNGNTASYTLDYQIVGPSSKAVWTTANKKVATVSKGKITAKGAGSTEVYVKANNLESKRVTVVVTSDQIVTLNQSEYMLYTRKGNTVTLKATTKPKKTPVWKSSDESVATVNKSGKVTAVGEGRTIITATVNGKAARCFVSVRDSKVVLEKQYMTLALGAKESIHADVIGAKQTVSYKSLNTKVAAVNNKGLITAKKEGEATIRVTANGVSAECKVWVKPCQHQNEAGQETWVEVSDEKKEATCLDDGITTYQCSLCQGKKQEVNPSVADHQFGRWIVVSDATENAEGLEKQSCAVCGTENTRMIPVKTRGDGGVSGKLVWEDNFDGDSLNLNDWNIETHAPGWVNQELQEYVTSENNTYVRDGKLYIRAIKEERDGQTYYTSGRINTQGKHDFTYGRFEARAKVPSGKGFLPAFWMMPTDENYYGQWPRCGEIDIMEVHGSDLSKSYGTLHFGSSQNTHAQSQGSYALPRTARNFWEDFHVFACEWEPGEIRFYVDGVLFHKENDWFTAKGDGYENVAYPAPFDQPFYMILNLAVGGSWVGYPDADQVFDEENAQFVIDYVRVYQKDSYDTDVDTPVKGEVIFREPDANGNYILNGNFAKAEDLTSAKSNWQLHLETDGAATARISQNKLHITTTRAGSQNHSVQVWQKGLPMRKNWQYKLTFDAYADEARTMITDVSAPDKNYKRYLADTTVELGTESKTYEYDFTVKDDDDANGRLEFNLGNQGSTAAVHITNVKLVKTGEVSDEGPVCLPNGNYVYNGGFDEGNEPGRFRLAHWDWDWRLPQGAEAKVSVTADAKRELEVVVPDAATALEQVTVSQEPIKLSGGKDYVLTFNARGDQAKKIQVQTAGQTFDCNLTTTDASYKYKFKTAADLSGSSKLVFLLGAPGTTYIDNVSIQEDSMIVNGDFSGGMTGYEVYVNPPAKAEWTVDSLKEDHAFSIDIADVGSESKSDEWFIQLKQNNVELKKDQWYKISFKAKSTMNRLITCALQRDGSADDDWDAYSGKVEANLTGEYQTFEKVFKMKRDDDAHTILSISMGQMGDVAIPRNTKHTVVIDDIVLEETEAQEEPTPDLGEELITNGDFSQGSEGWENAVTAPGAAEVSFADGNASYKISNVGTEDWHIQLKHKAALTLEKGASYQVTMKIKSTAARTVKYAFLDPTNDYAYYGGEDLVLAADELKTVDYTMNVTEATSSDISFCISMGKVGDATPLSTITIDDISVKKLSGGEEPGPEPPTVEPGEEMIVNGDFAQGETGWVNAVTDPGAAEVSFADGNASYKISNVGTEDWHIQLKQEKLLTLEKGAEYQVKFNITSTAARTVKYAFLTPTYAWYGGEDLALTANEKKEVDYKLTVGDKATSDQIQFLISMGQIKDDETGENLDTPVSDIVIDDISIKKLSGSEEPGPNPPVVEPGEELIKNGDFAKGDENWTGSYIDTAAKATKTFADNKARYEIKNAGTDDWNVQLKQSGLAMEKGASYKVNVTMGSTIDRDVKVAIMGSGDAWFGGADLALKTGKKHSFSRIIKLKDETIPGDGTLAFQLSMGKLGETDLAAHAIEIYSVSIKKVADDATADAETETDVTIAAPKEDSEEPDPDTPEDSTELIKNGDFASAGENWSHYIGNAASVTTPTFTDKKARYEIKSAGTADWNVQLKQEGLALEKGATYKVNLTLGSTIDRNVKFAIMGRNENAEEGKKDVWFGGADDISLTAGKKHTISRVVTLSNDETTSDTLAFQLSMGKLGDSDLAAHAIEIYSVSIKKVTDGTTADEETAEDVTIAAPEGGGEPETEPTTPKNLEKGKGSDLGEPGGDDDFDPKQGEPPVADGNTDPANKRNVAGGNDTDPSEGNTSGNSEDTNSATGGSDSEGADTPADADPVS